MTTAEPARPAAPRTGEVQASVLASLQLVEDARQFGTEHRSHRERVRLMTERALADRRLARDLTPGRPAHDLAG